MAIGNLTANSQQPMANGQKSTVDKLKSFNIEILCCEEKDGHVDINDLMMRLGEMGIDSLLLEGGATINAAFLEANCVDEIYAFVAPKIIGGTNSKSPVAGKGIDLMKDAIMLTDIRTELFDNDILIKGKIKSLDN